jgi:sugar lactone lactonase YvrE
LQATGPQVVLRCDRNADRNGSTNGTLERRMTHEGIAIFDPNGVLPGKILVPERAGKCVFGGPRRDTLCIAASTSLHRIVLDTHGAGRLHA